MSLGSLRIEASTTDGRVHARLAGELDMATAGQLEDLWSAHEDTGELLLDLRELVFMDSSGMRALLQLRERCEERGTQLQIVPGPPTVQRVFTLTGMDAVFELVEPPGAPETAAEA